MHVLRYMFQLSVAIWKQRSIRRTRDYFRQSWKGGGTPLLLATGHRKLEVFRFLIEIGADFNIRNVQSNTVLQQAAILIGLEIINILLDKEMSDDVTNGDNSTPLHIAPECGNFEGTKNLSKELLL